MKTKAWSFSITASKTVDKTGLFINFEQYSLLVRRDFTWGNYQMFKDKIIEAFSLLGYKSVNVFGVKTKISSGDKATLIAYDKIIEYFNNLITAKTLEKEPVAKSEKLELTPENSFMYPPRPKTPETVYKPKRGRLTIGTKLSVDWDNPVNHGKSGIPGIYVINDIIKGTTFSVKNNKSTTYKKYVVICTTEIPWRDGQPVRMEMTMEMTADEIFNWLKIDKSVKQIVKE
jgi:hypothetical protein